MAMLANTNIRNCLRVKVAVKSASRRHLISLLALSILVLIGKAYASISGQEMTNFEWRVSRSQVNIVKVGMDFDGKVVPDLATVTDTKGLPLVYILVGSASILQIAKTLLDVYRDFRYGGIVISGKDGEINIKNDARIAGGTIVVYDKNDIKFYFRKQENPTIGNLVEALTKISKNE